VGENISPPLAWKEVPSNAVELALVVQDPDAPLFRPVVHLVAVGLAPETCEIREGALSPPGDPSINLGRGSFGRIGYAGPRPVRGHGPHRYMFQIFALTRHLAIPKEPDLGTVLEEMSDSVLARGSLVGTYERT
jgi:Raf kinase inhibitor-like YbhB/YbcL family protein